MQPADFPAFREGLVEAMSFYEKTVSTTTLDSWWRGLRKYELAAVIEAFERYVFTPQPAGHYAPKPADITLILEGSPVDNALQAWTKVDFALREKGTYIDVVFDDPLIHRVIKEMGGWISFGTKTEDEWPFVAKEFETRYRGYTMRGETPEYPRILIGAFTAENRKNGHQSEKPLLIGNVQKAIQVMNGGSDRPALEFRQLQESVLEFQQVEDPAYPVPALLRQCG